MRPADGALKNAKGNGLESSINQELGHKVSIPVKNAEYRLVGVGLGGINQIGFVPEGAISLT
jgi:hypothetical protein